MSAAEEALASAIEEAQKARRQIVNRWGRRNRKYDQVSAAIDLLTNAQRQVVRDG